MPDDVLEDIARCPFGRSCLSRQRDPAWLLSARVSLSDAAAMRQAVSLPRRSAPWPRQGAARGYLADDPGRAKLRNSPLLRSDNLGILGLGTQCVECCQGRFRIDPVAPVEN